VAYKACDCHGQLFRGPTSHFYPTIIVDELPTSKKVRLCPSGLSDVLGRISRYYESSEGLVDGQMALFTSCCYCGVERTDGNGGAVFVTLYARGSARKDAAGAVCAEHLGQAAQDLFLTL
jgi:hypothetical protein